MRVLYDIANEYQGLMNQIMENDEILPEQLAAIELIDDSIKEKAVNVAAFIKNLEAESNGIEDAIKTMREREERVLKKIESLKEYLKTNLERCDIKEVRSPFFDIKIKTNPASVTVQDESLVPSQYFRELITKKIDKTLISQELKNNIMIPGVMLEKRSRLEIK